MRRLLLLFLSHAASTSNSVASDSARLFAAVASGDEAAVRDIVKSLQPAGAINSQAQPSGATALHIAAKTGNDVVVQILLDAKADVSMRTKSGLTALHYAANSGNAKSVAALLAAHEDGASLDSQASSGDSALHLSAGGGHAAAIRLLAWGGCNVNLPGALGATPLHVAAQGGHSLAVRELLEHGAATSARTSTGHTPLHAAAHAGHADIAAQLLLAAGSTDAIGAKDSAGDTPLHVAVAHGQTGVVRALLQGLQAPKGGGGVAKGDAADRTPDDRIAAVDAANGAGHAPLHLAVSYGQPEALRLLLAAGASADVRAAKGETPLVLAAQLGAPQLARVLIAAGADVNAQTWEHFSPLYIGVYMLCTFPAVPRWRELVALLLEAGASPNTPTVLVGGTALHVAGYFGSREAERMLRAHGAVEDGAYARHVAEGLQRAAADGGDGEEGAEAEPKSVDALSVALEDCSGGPRADDAERGTEGGAAEGGAAEGEEAAQQRALQVWRRQGAVVFPGLLPRGMIAELRRRADEARRGTEAEDRSSTIRSHQQRELRGIPVAHSGEVVRALAGRLRGFLSSALRSETLLLLESSCLVTRGGAEAQAWHTDVALHDERYAFVQVTLGVLTPPDPP